MSFVPSHADACAGEVAVAAGLLGAVCGAYLFETFEDFLNGVRVPGHPIQAVVKFVLDVRVYRRYRQNFAMVESQLVARRYTRGVNVLLQRSYGMYCALRGQAVPRA